MLIGITGAMGSGKSTVRKYLVEEYGYSWMSMADSLKDMLAVIGLTDAQLRGDEKEIPSDLLCGRTPRFAMQTIGTEWGRNMGSDLWVNVMRERLKVLPQGADVVIDDIRFPNEIALIEELFGVMWVVRRRRVEPEMGVISYVQKKHRDGVDIIKDLQMKLHPSERGWMVAKGEILHNLASEETLRQIVDEVLNA